MAHTDNTGNNVRRCRECGNALTCRLYKHIEQVGKAKVIDGTGNRWQCETCGDVELSADDLASYERRAAALVLRDGSHVNGDAIKYARKALGLRQTELASLLQCAPETVSRWENGTPMKRAEQLALVALIDGVECEGIDLNKQAAGRNGEVDGNGSRITEMEVKVRPVRKIA